MRTVTIDNCLYDVYFYRIEEMNIHPARTMYFTIRNNFYDLVIV